MKMLKFLRGKASDRKLRLFGCACCRRIWDLLPDASNQAFVEVIDDHPDGKFEDRPIQAAGVASSCREWELGEFRGYWAVKYLGRSYYKLDPLAAAPIIAMHALEARKRDDEATATSERWAQADLLRDLFGHLFSPALVDPRWLDWANGTVALMARLLDQERLLPEGWLDPLKLTVLADALEDAGCADADILGHLRGPGPHVRGCWVVDLLLGKS